MSRVTVDGCELHFEKTGQGSPLLLLHGLGSRTRGWDRQIPVFAERHTVIAVDMRGHGESDKRGPYGVPRFSADVARVLETLGVGPVHVVGLSMGGMVAFQLALDAPALVRTLTIANSMPTLIPHTPREWLKLQARHWIMRVFGLRALARKIAEINFPRDDQAELRNELVEQIACNDEATYRAVSESLVRWTVEARLGEVRSHTLVLTGDRDYTTVAYKRAYAARMPHAKVVVIENSGHLTPIDQPDAFNRTVLAFLTEHDGVAQPRVESAPSA
jgi:pimeloyl-ACP methyl ester carboxylesterase